MTNKDLEAEFRSTADFQIGMSEEDYDKGFYLFLQDKCIQTENSHQVALNIALERSDKIDQFRAKIKEQADQIESLKRQIKA